eukprot:6737627-Lingulodinium_polyedra.AAC.1
MSASACVAHEAWCRTAAATHRLTATDGTALSASQQLVPSNAHVCHWPRDKHRTVELCHSDNRKSHCQAIVHPAALESRRNRVALGTTTTVIVMVPVPGRRFCRRQPTRSHAPRTVLWPPERPEARS